MVVVKTIKDMDTSTSRKLVVDEITTPYLVLVTFHWCPLVPMKLQVREWNIRLNIQDLRCEMGATIYTLVRLELEICAFCRAIYKIQSKSSMRADSILHEGGPAQRMVLKAVSKMVSAAESCKKLRYECMRVA